MILEMSLKVTQHVLHFELQKEEPILHDIPGRPWETVGADLFIWNNKTYLRIVDYHSRLVVMKLMDGSLLTA